MVQAINRALLAFVALCVFGSIVLIGQYTGQINVPILAKPVKTLSEMEKECVVAAIHSDARWAGDADEAVRREVGLTVLRHAHTFHRDVCDVFTNGRTLVPEGHERKWPYARTVLYVRLSFESTSASWASNMGLVAKLMQEPIDGCATHYVRKARRTDWLAQPEDARAVMRASMHSVGHARQDGKEVGTAEFFCPR